MPKHKTDGMINGFVTLFAENTPYRPDKTRTDYRTLINLVSRIHQHSINSEMLPTTTSGPFNVIEKSEQHANRINLWNKTYLFTIVILVFHN
jgi:hypothetical protein